MHACMVKGAYLYRAQELELSNDALAATECALARAVASQTKLTQAYGVVALQNLGVCDPRVSHVHLRSREAGEIIPRQRYPDRCFHTDFY